MTEVEVSLATIVCHEHLPVLEGIHGARVDIDVGVELLVHDLQPSCLQEAAERCRRYPLAKAGNHPSRDEDVLGLGGGGPGAVGCGFRREKRPVHDGISQ